MASARRRVYYGWWIVLAYTAMNVYWAGALVYGLTVFFRPVQRSFGWGDALLSLIFSISGVLTSLVAPLVGAWFDRVGPRALMLFAGFCGGAGLLLLSRADSLGSFVAAYIVMSLGFGVWGAGTGPAAAGLWFVRRRGLAMGLILGGVSLGGLLVPVWKAAVDTAGWRTAFVLVGLGLLALNLPLSLVLRHRPSDLGLLPDGDAAPPAVARGRQPAPLPPAELGLGGAIRSWQFWTVSATVCAVLAGSQATQLLMLPRLKDAGLRDDVAVAAVTAVTVLGIAGKLGGGWLADRADAALLASASFGLQALGLLAFALAPDNALDLLIFVFAFGVGSDNSRLFAALIFTRYFGPGAFGRIQGIFFVVLLPGRVLGPVIAGALHDAGHGYGPAFVGFALLTLAMAPPLLALRPPAPRLSPSPSAPA